SRGKCDIVRLSPEGGCKVKSLFDTRQSPAREKDEKHLWASLYIVFLLLCWLPFYGGHFSWAAVLFMRLIRPRMYPQWHTSLEQGRHPFHDKIPQDIQDIAQHGKAGHPADLLPGTFHR